MISENWKIKTNLFDTYIHYMTSHAQITKSKPSFNLCSVESQPHLSEVQQFNEHCDVCIMHEVNRDIAAECRCFQAQSPSDHQWTCFQKRSLSKWGLTTLSLSRPETPADDVLYYHRVSLLTLQSKDFLQCYRLPCHGSMICLHLQFEAKYHFLQLPMLHPVSRKQVSSSKLAWMHKRTDVHSTGCFVNTWPETPFMIRKMHKPTDHTQVQSSKSVYENHNLMFQYK
jgi:hypothetical protein